MIVPVRSLVLAVVCTAGALSLACEAKPVRGTYLASHPAPVVEVVRRGEVEPVSDAKPRIEPVVGPISKAPPLSRGEPRTSTVETKVVTKAVPRCWNGARPPCKPAPADLRFEF